MSADTFAHDLFPLRTSALDIIDAVIRGCPPASAPLAEAERTPAPSDGVGRVSAPDGLTKYQRRVWDWLSAHDADVTHDLPSSYDLANATGVSKSVCAKVVKAYRERRGQPARAVNRE